MAQRLISSSIGLNNIPGLPVNGISGLQIQIIGGADRRFRVTAGSAVIAGNNNDRWVVSLPNALIKTGALWAKGDNAGSKIGSASFAPNRTYHVYLIYHPRTREVDIAIDNGDYGEAGRISSAFAGMLGRIIGSLITDSASYLMEFVQYEDCFWWQFPKTDVLVNSNYPAIAGNLQKLTVPDGIITRPIFRVNTSIASDRNSLIATNTDFSMPPLVIANYIGIPSSSFPIVDRIPADINGEISLYYADPTATNALGVYTFGFYHSRGKGSI